METEVPSILKKIWAEKDKEVEKMILSGKASEYLLSAKPVEPIKEVKPFGKLGYFGRSLVKPLEPGQLTRVIAEIKRASPSEGHINQDLDPAQMARTYEFAGAAAISILTDSHFNGSQENFDKVRMASGMPILRKDFMVHPAQIYESSVWGADAILLIVAGMYQEQLRDYLQAAHELGIDCLTEVHDRAQLDTALEAGANIIGVNNRDLNTSTFEIDLKTSTRLSRYIPKDKIYVSESGVRTYSDIKFLCNRKRAPEAILTSAPSRAENPRKCLDRLLEKHLPTPASQYSAQEQ